MKCSDQIQDWFDRIEKIKVEIYAKTHKQPKTLDTSADSKLATVKVKLDGVLDDIEEALKDQLLEEFRSS